MIESVNNEKVKYWTKLNDKKYQIEEGLFLVEGTHLVDEAKKSGHLKEVIVLDGFDYDFEQKTFVNEQVMKKISSLLSLPKVVGIAEMICPREIRGNVLLLDGLQDPGNMGTIIRSAVAFGIDTIVVGAQTVSVYNPKVVRATEGLLFHINIINAELAELIQELKSDGYKVFSSQVDGGVELKNVSFGEKNAIIIGNEGNGVRKELSELCDEYLYIPMDSSCESLNAGVATSIILYELKR